jgi:regulator of sigma E protease
LSVVTIVQGAVGIGLFILILGILVLIHEIGHFVTARRAGVRVHEFGIGFPPRAKVLRSDGETLYTLNWLPIGGFVKLEGEDGDSDDPRSFTRASFLTKQWILSAGVLMNLLLALVLMVGVAWIPQRILALGFETVQPDSPAAGVGLVGGSQLIAIDGRYYDAFDGPQAMVDDLRARAGEAVDLEIVTPSGARQEVTVELRGLDEIGKDKGALGIVTLQADLLDETFTRSPLDALSVGAQRTVAAFGLILDGLAQLVTSIATRPTEPPPVTGPIGIAVSITDVFWQAGIVATIYLAGLLSANLALVNILPFPPLDGGRMLMLAIKKVAGARVSVRAEQLTYVVGFMFLFGFLIWITVFDLARLGGAVQ